MANETGQIDGDEPIPVRAVVLAHLRRYLDTRPHGEVAALARELDRDIQKFSESKEQA